MDEFRLHEINDNIKINDNLIEQLTNISKIKSAPKKEIKIVLDWLNNRQKLLDKRYSKIVKDLSEEADLISSALSENSADSLDEWF